MRERGRGENKSRRCGFTSLVVLRLSGAYFHGTRSRSGLCGFSLVDYTLLADATFAPR